MGGMEGEVERMRCSLASLTHVSLHTCRLLWLYRLSHFSEIRLAPSSAHCVRCVPQLRPRPERHTHPFSLHSSVRRMQSKPSRLRPSSTSMAAHLLSRRSRGSPTDPSISARHVRRRLSGRGRLSRAQRASSAALQPCRRTACAGDVHAERSGAARQSPLLLCAE